MAPRRFSVLEMLGDLPRLLLYQVRPSQTTDCNNQCAFSVHRRSFRRCRSSLSACAPSCSSTPVPLPAFPHSFVCPLTCLSVPDWRETDERIIVRAVPDGVR